MTVIIRTLAGLALIALAGVLFLMSLIPEMGLFTALRRIERRGENG